MILHVDDWIFDVDMEQAVAYSQSILPDHCQCGYCRNFYQAVDSAYPHLRSFLARFGRDVTTPDELMPFEPTLYEATYCISGEIISVGAQPIKCDGLTVIPLDADSLDFDSDCKVPFFALCVKMFPVPWVLDEDMDEVVSPANEPEYLQRMWNKLLQNTPEETLFS